MKRLGAALFLWILIISFGIMMPNLAWADEEKLYTAEGHRDPFVQLVMVSGSRQTVSGLLGVENIDDIRVEGVVMDVDPRKSIIIANGTVLKEGDEFGSVKLLKIQADGGVFSVNGIEGFKALYQEK